MKTLQTKVLLILLIGFFVLTDFVIAQTSDTLKLPQPQMAGGKPLMDALKDRHSSRDFSTDKLPLQLLSNLLWAADGYNRPAEKKRTAPSSMNYQEIDIYLALEQGFYKYDAEKNVLVNVLKEDIRAYAGKQDFVKTAPLNLVYIADYSKVKKPLSDYQYKASYANTGFIAENVYLFCSSEELACVIRAFFDEKELSEKIKLNPDQKIILSQTIGYPKKQ